MTKKIWYAVSKTGQGRVFTTCPVRNEHFGIWEAESIGCISTLFMLFESDGLQVPNLKWDDDPVALELTMAFCDIITEK